MLLVGTQQEDVGLAVPNLSEVGREVRRVRGERLVDNQFQIRVADFVTCALRGRLAERAVFREDRDGLRRRVLREAHVDVALGVLVRRRQEAEDPLVALCEYLRARTAALDHRLLVLCGHGAGGQGHRTGVRSEQVVDALAVDEFLVDRLRLGGVCPVVTENHLQFVGVAVPGLNPAGLINALDGQLVGVFIQLAEVGVVPSETHRTAELDDVHPAIAIPGGPAVTTVTATTAIAPVTTTVATVTGTASEAGQSEDTCTSCHLQKRASVLFSSHRSVYARVSMIHGLYVPL